MSEALLIAQVALQLTSKLQEALRLNAKAVNGTLTDEDVRDSTISRDLQLAKTAGLGHEG